MSLLELLVVLLVLGLLVSLLAPAVQAVRESARRMQCQNHLRSIGQSLHGFEQSYRRFPGFANRDNGENWAPHVVLLPHLDQANLWRQIPLSSGAYCSPNSPLESWAATPVASFLCPSDLGNRGNNYVACIGAGARFFDESHGGAFGWWPGHVAGDFTDGMSNTAAFSEHLKEYRFDGTFDPQIHYWISRAVLLPGGYGDADDLVAICQSLTGTPAAFVEEIGTTWHFASYGQTWYNHAIGPNPRGPACTAQGNVFCTSGDGVHPARSRHGGSVNVLMMDGAVRSVADSIDLRVWRALGTLAAGDTTD
jgi:prepilin-type processing-associated H-X9-DG protein